MQNCCLTISCAGAGTASGAPRQPAKLNGVLVCFGFNSTGGCRRMAPGAPPSATCKDATTTFAHVCNAYIKAKNAYCLALHSRINGNH